MRDYQAVVNEYLLLDKFKHTSAKLKDNHESSVFGTRGMEHSFFSNTPYQCLHRASWDTFREVWIESIVVEDDKAIVKIKSSYFDTPDFWQSDSENEAWKRYFSLTEGYSGDEPIKSLSTEEVTFKIIKADQPYFVYESSFEYPLNYKLKSEGGVEEVYQGILDKCMELWNQASEMDRKFWERCIQ